MSQQVKGMLIEAIAERLGDTQEVLVVDTARMDAITNNEFRAELQKKGIHALTVKNALARRALERRGIVGLDGILEGPSTLVFGGGDVVALSKEIVEQDKKHKSLDVKGGTVEGQSLDAGGVTALSKSPSREDLLATIAGQILAPGANLAAALLGPGATLASQLKSIADGGDAAGE